MTHEHATTAHPRSEDDRIDGRAVALVGAGSLAVFAAASLAAGGWLHLTRHDRPAPPLPPELGDTKIAMVEQRLFEGPLRGELDRDARQRRLASLGWVDREKGLAHVPIEVAMALVAEGVRLPPAEPPAAPPLSAARGGVDAPSVPVLGPRATVPPGGPGAPARGDGRSRPPAGGSP